MSSPPDAGDTAGASSSDRVVVYDLAAECTLKDVTAEEYYHATVNGVVDYGIFVDISDEVSGLVHESALDGSYEVGDELIVYLTEIRENGDLSFTVADLPDYETVTVAHDYEISDADSLTPSSTDTIHLEGEVVQIKQTGGPTIFQVRDETAVVPCAAFEDAGVRAYPDIEVGDVVRVTGVVDSRDDAIQVEASNIDALDGEEATEVAARLESALDARAEAADVDPLIDWPAFEKLRPDLKRVATLLRRTVLEGRPIKMRHHADGDGMCASVPVQLAIERFIEETHQDPSAPRHLLKRLPSKAPFYEMEDVVRDLNFSLEDRARHGQKLPLLLMLDNGSTEEDIPAYQNLAHYDIPIVVVDHHHPDPEAVEPLVEEHVNPYMHDEDYRITTGMMCVELARMIYPDLADELNHVPAVAGLTDRSKAEAMEQYIDLAEAEGYTEDDLWNIGEALDYEAYWLKYNDGRDLINDILNVACDDEERHRKLVEFLSSRAERDVEKQLDSVMPHVEHEVLDNDAHLYRIDLERHAHRFTYPAPGKTTGEIHDRKVKETGESVITIGYGPDFTVLRSDGVRLDIPNMVQELNEEVKGGGVSGGGHLVVGSIKFVKGMREEVLDALVEKMAAAEIDEELRSTIVTHD
ncbi:DHH family phosphoesterase [Haladaptatus sp. DYSN1]|uniref:DHH family phosphoesterase n=1 Tax=unclassified Haladaptatus TaxID=2622732 RepID=UPI00240670C9|nr:OB-fold nucleic acid binding domain-containing protein [Haladaptatus sp. DYSN1]